MKQQYLDKKRLEDFSKEIEEITKINPLLSILEDE